MLPYTKDSVNYQLDGCTVRFLTMDDVISEHDFIREIVIDNYANPYKGDTWNDMYWHRVTDDIPYWVGQTPRELSKALGYDGQILYDIVRVIIPDG